MEDLLIPTAKALAPPTGTAYRRNRRRRVNAPLPPSASASRSIHSVAQRRFLARLRYQLLFGLNVAVAIPTLIATRGDLRLVAHSQSGLSTVVGSTFAFLVATYLFRRMASFPGSGILGHVLPALTAAYGMVLITLFASRLEYSRIVFFGSFVGASIFFLLVSFYIRNRVLQRFYVVPSARAHSLLKLGNVDWVVLNEAALPADQRPVIIADLHADLEPRWERLIAEAALAGHPVYHMKQVEESLTGQVEIEHLSENSFGSLLPNHGYLKVKRGVDLIVALVALPILIIPLALCALWIRLDSPGPIFFRQERRGHRGQLFEVLKFRTMRFGSTPDEDFRDAAITLPDDDRITRVGHFLRRTRIDELPQIWNVIRGEMSWIGPRPEAQPLSDWYSSELPFYSYRHILRPGITGWAQVNQGHVSDLESVFMKLKYDFYYIKHFSAWLDVLILGKTINIVCFGQGAK